MNETLKAILVAIAAVVVFIVAGALVCVAFGWLNIGLMALSGRVFSRLTGAESPDSIQRAANRRLARLRNPQFGVLEAHFGAPVPESLRRLYRNADLSQQEDFRLADPQDPNPDGGDLISEFLPADKKALDDIVWEFGEPLFPFANDGFGNYYCVLIQGEPSGPCPVYFWDHEIPGSLEEMKIAGSLDEFLSRPRVPPPSAVG